MIVLILSSEDAVLTLVLISRGAVEINPLMEPLEAGAHLRGVVVSTMVTRWSVANGPCCARSPGH